MSFASSPCTSSLVLPPRGSSVHIAPRNKRRVKLNKSSSSAHLLLSTGATYRAPCHIHVAALVVATCKISSHRVCFQHLADHCHICQVSTQVVFQYARPCSMYSMTPLPCLKPGAATLSPFLPALH
mmetsp:Transcript_27050/g.46647  ORF Transcript_27050/g.46647 Transcript_27050/m.46647 type:complete len:126 (+) Transcript_27050:206-583(+)